jgi:hypothetical protein
MTTVYLALGWMLIGLSALSAVAMHRTDRRMQVFRAPGAPPAAFSGIPLRWKRELYAGEGRALVRRAWSLMLLMYGAALVGIVLLSRGVDALP